MLRDPHVLVAAGVVATTLVASVTARVIAPGRGYVPEYERKAKAIARQGLQIANAAQQDTNAAFALQHVTQALALFDAATQLVGEETLQRVSGVDVHALTDKLRKKQTSVLEHLQKSGSH